MTKALFQLFAQGSATSVRSGKDLQEMIVGIREI